MTQDTVFACDELAELQQHNALLKIQNKELLARCDLLEAELEQEKDKNELLESELYQRRKE